MSWIDFKGSQARFAHVGTERPCELIADQLGEWKTLTDHLPGLSPGEAREHTFRVVDQRIILVGEVVDVRGHALPSIRLMARETAMWSHTAEASPEGRIRLPLIQAEGSGEVELLGISTDGASWDLVGSIQVPEHVSSGEYDFGKVVMEPKVTVAGTFRTSSGLPVVHSFVNVVQQADSGLWERAEMSVMAGEGGQFTTTRDVEDDSMPLAFYQFEPISTAEGRHLIETPVPFARGARNVEVVLTPAVHLKGSVEIPEGVRARDVRIALVREGCPTRTIQGVQRDGSFESWQPQGTFDVEVRVSRPSDPLVRISNVVLRPGDEAPAVLQGIRQAR